MTANHHLSAQRRLTRDQLFPGSRQTPRPQPSDQNMLFLKKEKNKRGENNAVVLHWPSYRSNLRQTPPCFVIDGSKWLHSGRDERSRGQPTTRPVRIWITAHPDRQVETLLACRHLESKADWVRRHGKDWGNVTNLTGQL